MTKHFYWWLHYVSCQTWYQATEIERRFHLGNGVSELLWRFSDTISEHLSKILLREQE